MLAAVLLPIACRGAEAMFDVAVVGAGPAGIGAALTSAETGARTVVLERQDFVGGTTVSAEVKEIGLFHAWRRQIIAGPCWNLVSNVVESGGGHFPDFRLQNGDTNWWVGVVRVDPVRYSAAALKAIRDAGADVRLSSCVTGLVREADCWRLVGQDSKGGFAVCARQIVDATGSASVAAMAGAARNRPDEAERQPGSSFFWLNTVGMAFDAKALDSAQAQSVRSGELLSTDVFIPMSEYVRHGGGWGTYVPGADDSSEAAQTETRRLGRELQSRVLAFLRRQPGLEKTEIVHAAPEVGVRETYRVVGEETVTKEDYLEGTMHPDTVCWSFWMIDLHCAQPGKQKFEFHRDGKVGTIRLGAMIPKGVKNLLVAGRAVSSDRAANSALRVQASCMAMGQVAGTVAALAAKKRIDPRKVPLAEIRASLRSVGAIVPGE